MVERITPAGTITAFTPPTRGFGIADITTGPDGSLWFTEAEGGKMGRATVAAAIVEYPIAFG